MRKTLIVSFFMLMIALCWVAVHVGAGLRINGPVSKVETSTSDIDRPTAEAAGFSWQPGYSYTKQETITKSIYSNGLWYYTQLDTTAGNSVTYHKEKE